MAYKFRLGDNCSHAGRKGAVQDWGYHDGEKVRKCSRRRAMSAAGWIMCLVWFPDTDTHEWVRWVELVYEPPTSNTKHASAKSMLCGAVVNGSYRPDDVYFCDLPAGHEGSHHTLIHGLHTGWMTVVRVPPNTKG